MQRQRQQFSLSKQPYISSSFIQEAQAKSRATIVHSACVKCEVYLYASLCNTLPNPTIGFTATGHYYTAAN